MSAPEATDREDLREQYRDGTNLSARVRLHQRFSTNKHGWHRWVFDQLDLPPSCRILELGCGIGTLWLQNLSRIPPGWTITLSDFSEGMLQQAAESLGGHGNFASVLVDAGASPFPFEAGHFDAVIANHMLSHVADKAAAFSEIRRILKPGGRFFAATNGRGNLGELVQLLKRFDPQRGARWEQGGSVDSFCLENGAGLLAPWFEDVALHRYEDSLHVTEPGPLMDYVMSGWMDIDTSEAQRLRALIEDEMRLRGGCLDIGKDAGLFVSVRQR